MPSNATQLIYKKKRVHSMPSTKNTLLWIHNRDVNSKISFGLLEWVGMIGREGSVWMA